jgi:hypothetical protein
MSTFLVSLGTEDLVRIWRSGQILLPNIIRWSKYVDNRQYGSVRSQNTLQHTHALVTLGSIMIPVLAAGLDEVLLLKALHFHDEGEGLVGFDTLYIDKSELGDLKEYLAFRQNYCQLPARILERLETAFLLQFASKNPECFPPKARSIMTQLQHDKTMEILAFEAIERFDYYLYAVEQFVDHDNIAILLQTLRNQIDRLDGLAQILPGFANFWNPTVQQSCRELLSYYSSEFLEEKSKV